MAAEWLRGFEATRDERREIIRAFAEATGTKYDTAARSFQRYTTENAAERRTPDPARQETLARIVSEFYSKQPSLGANTDDLGYATRPIDRNDLRYRDRDSAETVANAILNNRYDAFHSNRITAVHIEFLPPGTKVDVYNPTTRRMEPQTVGRYGEWVVRTQGYSSKDVPVETP